MRAVASPPVSPSGTVLSGLVAGLLLLAAATPAPAGVDLRALAIDERAVAQELRVTGELELSRSVRHERIEVLEGATLRITDDVLLEAVSEIVIRGALVTEVPPGDARASAPGLHLRAGERIVIEGEVRLADGRPGTVPGMAGGGGGSITLDAPLCLVSRDLVAGRGGDGGPAAAGGAGGSIRVASGALYERAGVEGLVARAGDGGDGGPGIPGAPDGAVGGRGGDALLAAPDTGTAGNDVATAPPRDGEDGLPCFDGIEGLTSPLAIGGGGGKGGEGDSATVAGATGGTGGTGGRGGDAVSGGGSPGGKGGPCGPCTLGGTGGKGGPANGATGGPGGTGGLGGYGTVAGANGGDGGVGGAGGSATAAAAGPGGEGGECCVEDGVGGDGGPGGDALRGNVLSGSGGAGGPGGNGGTAADQGGTGGRGGKAGSAFAADAGAGGKGGIGEVQAGDGGAGSENPGVATAGSPGVGGAAGWPDGTAGDFGPVADAVEDGDDGPDGEPGLLCAEVPEEGQEEDYYHDGSFENGFAWELAEVAPPYFGAFAVRHEVDGVIDAIHLHLTQLDDENHARLDLYLWEDDGGQPGDVIAVFPGRDPGPVAHWPEISAHRFPIDHAVDGPTPVWVGMWGDWPGQALDYFLAVDHDGPGGGTPHTNVAPGLEWPEGWQPVSVPFSEAALGIGIEVTPLGACCTESGPESCCSLTDEVTCLDDGGTYLGDGTSCVDSPCGVDRPSLHTLTTPCFDLDLTDRGSVGFLDASQADGLGWRFPAGGPNHLRIGGLWVGLGPDSVLHRSYLGDPSPTWNVSSCPAGQIHVESELPGPQVARSLLASTAPGRELPGFMHEQRGRAWSTPEACGYAILEFTGQPVWVPGEERLAYYGLFLDLDVAGTAEDDQGGVIPEENLVYLTDPTGAYLGIRVLDGTAGPEETHLTLIPNEVFVDPEGYVSEADKWAFLSAADPDHVIHDGELPRDHAILAARAVTAVGEEEPVWPVEPEFAVALVVGHDLGELIENAALAQEAYGEGVLDVVSATTVPGALALAPNPFRRSSTLRFGLARPDRVTIDVHDATGRRVRRLLDGALPSGAHTLQWDGRTGGGDLVSPGVYFVQLRSGERITTRKLLRVP